MPVIGESTLWGRTRDALSASACPTSGPSADAVPPPADRGPRRRLDDVLVARRSVRSFAPTPLPGAVVRQVLDTARAADASLWSGLEVPGSAPVVEVSTPGDELHDLLVRQYVDAPSLLLVLADVAAATAIAGGPGYRQCLLRAAGFGYAAWLAALALDLGGSVYGRSSPQVTSALRARDRGTRRHLFTVALGEPA